MTRRQFSVVGNHLYIVIRVADDRAVVTYHSHELTYRTLMRHYSEYWPSVDRSPIVVYIAMRQARDFSSFCLFMTIVIDECFTSTVTLRQLPSPLHGNRVKNGSNDKLNGALRNGSALALLNACCPQYVVGRLLR